MDDFSGKVAVVTGTANPRGIGMAIVRDLAALGCAVVLADLDADGAEAQAAELRTGGADATAVAVDMSDYASVTALADAVYARHGKAHIVVLNHVAPTGRAGHGLLNPDPFAWELHANVNYLGTVYGIKAFAHRMIEGGEHGHILATTSGAGYTGVMYGNGPYACTKSAIVTLMECLYGQLRDAKADIVAGLISPGLTNTFETRERTEQTVGLMRATGLPATFTEPEEVAQWTIEAIRHDRFWAHAKADSAHAETVVWQEQIFRARAEALVNRDGPDTYLWGPPSRLMGE